MCFQVGHNHVTSIFFAVKVIVPAECSSHLADAIANWLFTPRGLYTHNIGVSTTGIERFNGFVYYSSFQGGSFKHISNYSRLPNFGQVSRKYYQSSICGVAKRDPVRTVPGNPTMSKVTVP
jgi:hypothetical protein